jgi:flagellar biosynthetic protein FliP
VTRRAIYWQLGATALIAFVALLAAPAAANPSRVLDRVITTVVQKPAGPGQGAPAGPGPGAPAAPTPPAGPGSGSGSGTVGITVDTGTGGGTSKPSTSITLLIALTVLSVAPALLLLCTSFTKIFVVLSITRNALGLTSVPPNQVLSGLALFLSLFVMAPVLSDMNHDGVQPYLKGTKTQAVAFHDGVEPLRTFMLHHTRKDEIALLTRVSNAKQPANANAVPLQTLIPSFVLSELRAAFIIGFVVYIPFLVIDMVVSASLMSMGMMMLPPVTVSLPFKMLLFVLVNGWGLVITALVSSYR